MHRQTAGRAQRREGEAVSAPLGSQPQQPGGRAAEAPAMMRQAGARLLLFGAGRRRGIPPGSSACDDATARPAPGKAVEAARGDPEQGGPLGVGLDDLARPRLALPSPGSWNGIAPAPNAGSGGRTRPSSLSLCTCAGTLWPSAGQLRLSAGTGGAWERQGGRAAENWDCPPAPRLPGQGRPGGGEARLALERRTLRSASPAAPMFPARLLASWWRPPGREMVTVGDLPPDILEDVLSRVPGRDLVCSCRLVCAQWRTVVDLPALWKRKCQREGYRPHAPDRSIPDWKTFYFLSVMKRNLIRNPCGEKGLKFWEFKSKKKKVWKIEKAPEANVYFPHIRKCFVAYHLCTFKHQLITLQKEGYWDELMDKTKPDIVVKDWYFFSPNYRYELCVKLLSADFSVLQECFPEQILRNQERGEDKWCEVSYTFHDYPAGVRYIRFIHGSEGWTYMRVTNSSITVGPDAAPRGEEPGPHALDQLCEPQRQPCPVF